MGDDSLISRFQAEKLLNQDSGGRRIIIQGTIDTSPALLLAERGAFETNATYLQSFPNLITNLTNLGDNDIYHWYLANSVPGVATPADLKLNLIYPSTDKHIKKYSFQQSRSVTETPEIYAKYTLPYMRQCREEGRLNWVFNILEGRSEQENVLYRSSEQDPKDNYLLLPDLNWDRKTTGSLHLLALVERRDLWSVRDLKKRDASWLRRLLATLAKQTQTMFPSVEADMLKFYVHYQPTYYHFHVHVVHVNLDAGLTQAVGKAIGLGSVIAWLESMSGDEETGMKDVELTFGLGEQSELWTKIFAPLKEGRTPEVSE